MAAHAAVRLMRMNANLARILAVEAMSAAQGIAFRTPLKTAPALQAALGVLHEDVPVLEADRYMARDIEHAAELVRSGALLRAAGLEIDP